MSGAENLVYPLEPGRRPTLLYAEPLRHRSLQAGLVQNVESQFFAGDIASAARRALAESSEASSMVTLGSRLITDMTMLIMTCRRLIFLASS